ncbi:MAG: response regulator [Flavobacterium sp.]
MKNIIKSRLALIIAIVGFIGGTIWCLQTNFNIEPLILAIISILEILGFFLIPESIKDNSEIIKVKNEQNVNVNVTVGDTNPTLPKSEKPDRIKINRSEIIDIMQPKTSVLFIDDDTNFNVVQILKDSGWKKSKTVPDIKTLDVPAVRDADIIFVDINGVGKLLKLEFEGLDLALMLKQKYSEKKVIIYSANRNSNSFHKAWDICDFKLEKNALPYQFQNLVEEYSIEKYNSKL